MDNVHKLRDDVLLEIDQLDYFAMRNAVAPEAVLKGALEQAEEMTSVIVIAIGPQGVINFGSSGSVADFVFLCEQGKHQVMLGGA
jgi:hypothetical protein